MSISAKNECECMEDFKDKEFEGFKIVNYGRVKYIELYDENFDINEVPGNWHLAVSFAKYGVTYTPEFLRKLRKNGYGIEKLRGLVIYKNNK